MFNYFQPTVQKVTETLLPEPLSELYLAKGLVEEVPSRIEGLFKRYPLIWEKRKKGTSHESSLLMDDDFKKSFLKLYLYYFLMESNQDSTLRQEIDQIIKKIRPSYYNQLHKYEGLISSRMLDKWLMKFHGVVSSYDKLFIDFACLDWLAKGRHLSFEWSSFYQEFYLNQLMDVMLDMKVSTMEGSFYNRIKKLPFLVEQSFKQFEEAKKIPFNQYCERVWKELLDDEISWDEYYGLSLYTWTFLQNTPQNLKFRSEECLKIFTHAVAYYFNYLPNKEQVKILKTKQISLGEQGLNEIQQLIPFAMIQHLIAKQIEQNRIRFFDSIQTHDIQLAQQLKVENQQLKQTVSTMKKDHKNLIQEKEWLKKSITTQIKQAIEEEHGLNRELERTLNRVHSEKDVLKNELERLKEELRKVKEENEGLKERIQTLDEEANETILTQEQLEMFNQPSNLFVGGFPTVMNRLKDKLPQCKYFDCGTTVQDDFFDGVKNVYVMTRYVNHGMVYQVEKNLPTIPIKGISTTNLSRIFAQLGE